MVETVPTVVGVGFLFIVLSYVISAGWIHLERTYAPNTPRFDTAGLDHYELALLAAGKWRMGQVALAQAYLDGSVRVERRAGFLRRARLRTAPGVLEAHQNRHPILELALYRALGGSPDPVTMPAERLVAAALTVVAFASLALSPLGIWAVALCGLWLAAYGVFAATKPFCGSRTPAGDVVLAEARARLSEVEGWDHDRLWRSSGCRGYASCRT